MIFPYQPYLAASSITAGPIIYRPEIPIRVTGPTGFRDLRALVDPGSDDTILPCSIGSLVGVVFDQLESRRGGQVVSCDFKRIRVEGMKRNVKIALGV